MKKLFAGILFSLVAASLAHAQTSPILTKDMPSASDHPLVGRYTGSVLISKTRKDFDEIKLPNGRAEGASYSQDKKFSSTLTLQGTITRAIYIAPQGRSSLEVTANFLDSVKAKGFDPVFQCSGEGCGESFVVLKYRWDRPETKVLGPNYEQLRQLFVDAAFDAMIDVRYSLLKKPGADGDTYVALYSGVHRGGSFGDYSRELDDRVGVLVEVVEPRVMEKRMQMVSAAEIGGKVATDGKAIFYGILFDFDKADIKPESAPQLAEMAKFLQTNQQLRGFVVGHTDNKGGVDYNVALSNRRAEAVVKALASRHGIDAKRLTARGLGPLAPVASNRSEDGQAKNRRVELVEQ